MHYDQFSEELQKIIQSSWEIAISYHHHYVHTDHLFLAMLQHDCRATPFLKGIDRDKWIKITKDNNPADTATPLPDNLPPTIDVDRVIIHAWTFSASRNESPTNSVDLLLAMLAYNNPIKDDLSKAGWLLDHVLLQEHGPNITFSRLPLKKETTTSISKIGWALMSKERRKKTIVRWHRNASILMRYHMHKEATAICNNALAVCKDDHRFITFLALIAYRERNYPAMDSWLKRLKEHAASKDWLEQMYVLTEARKGNYTPAILNLEQQLAIQPENEIFLNNIGYYLSKQGQFEAALTYLEKSIRIAPNFGLPHNNLGFVLYRLGQQQAGIAAIIQSLDLDKGNSYAYKNLGIIYMETGDTTKAKEQFELALKYKYTASYNNEVEELLQGLNQD